MSRLPIPGNDDDVWGSILNDYLEISHNQDGTLRVGALTQAGGIISVNGKTTTNGSISLSASDVGAPTTLAGLGDVTTGSPVNNQVLTYDSTTAKWTNQNSLSGVVLDTTASDIHPLGVRAAGSVGSAADAGHVHAMPRLDQVGGPTASVSLNSQKITNLANGTVATDAAAFGQLPTALPPSGSAGGDLSGTYPNPTVASTHLSAPLPVNQGGTGSVTQNFVDLTTNQTKTGSLTVPLLDAGGQVFDVKAYGATGNGSTDDTSAINSAIAAANSAGAGQVFFPGGTYMVSSTLTSPATGITLAGNSLSSVIQLFPGFTGSSVIPLNNPQTAIINLQLIGGNTTSSGTPATNLAVTAGNPAVNFIEITGAGGCLVDNIFATYINGYIVEAVGTASLGPTKLVINNIRGQYNACGIHTLGLAASNHNMQAVISDCNLQRITSGDIVLVEDSNDVQITNLNGSVYGNSTSNASALRVHGACASILVFNIDVGAFPTKPAATPAVLIESGANGDPSNVNLFGGIFQSCQIGLSITGGSKQVIAQGLRVQSNGQYGLSITDTVSDIQINNSIFNTNGQTAAANNYDVFINTTGSGINIMRCDFSTPLGTGTGQVSNVGYNVTGNNAVWEYCTFLGSGGFNVTNIFSGNPLSSLFNRIGNNVASINVPNTAFSNSIALPVYTGGASTAGIVVQGAPSQVSKLLQLEDSTGATFASFDVGGNLIATSATLSGVSSVTTAGTGAGMSVTDSTNGGEYRAKLDSTHYVSVKKKSSAGSQIQAVEATGNSTLDLDAVPSDGSSQSIVRVARNTNTSNAGSGFYIYRGDGTATVQSFFGTQTSSYLNATGGNVAIGKSSASTMLDVNGKATMTGFNLSNSPASGYVLTSDSSGNGTWQPPSSPALTPTPVKTGVYAANAGDFVPFDASGGSGTVTLPNASADGSRVEVKMINTAASNTVTINTSGSDVFNKAGGSTSATLSLINQAVMLQYAASSGIWYVQGDDLPLSQLDGRYGLLSGATFTGAVSAPDFSVSGLTGATAASRYVGATTGGAPLSGTFNTGDFIVDQTGIMWICVSGGTPGTWAQGGVTPGQIPSTPTPSSGGFVAWTCDPEVSATSASIAPLGRTMLNAVYINQSLSITKIFFFVGTGATTPTVGENWAGIYNSSGTLLASVGIDSNTSSPGLQTCTISSTALTPGMYWIALLFNAGAAPQLYRAAGTMLAAFTANVSAASYRCCTNGSGLTGLAPTITPSSNTVGSNPQAFWLAIA